MNRETLGVKRKGDKEFPLTPNPLRLTKRYGL